MAAFDVPMAEHPEAVEPKALAESPEKPAEEEAHTQKEPEHHEAEEPVVNAASEQDSAADNVDA